MNRVKWTLRLLRNKRLTTWRKVQILLELGDVRFEIPETGQGQFIYALIDPISLKIFYVGRSNNPGRRYFEHYNEIDTTNKAKRINRLKRRFHMPYMIILEQCGYENVNNRERYWIHRFGGKRRLENMKE